MKRSKIAVLMSVVGIAATIRADDSRFDLSGPKIDFYVTRGVTTLPISQVPTLLSHNTLRVRADLPRTQSNHPLLIVAFLRSTTNEPSDDWFTKVETWRRPAADTRNAVLEGAQKALMFDSDEAVSAGLAALYTPTRRSGRVCPDPNSRKRISSVDRFFHVELHGAPCSALYRFCSLGFDTLEPLEV